jgi:ribosome biogenesis GTPase / thiamine phosphate phosphatase
MANTADSGRDPCDETMPEHPLLGAPDSLDSPPSTVRLEGIVTAVAHGFFEVATVNSTYLCTLRGRLRKSRPLLPPQRPARLPPPRRGIPRRGASPVGALDEVQETAAPRIAPGDRVLVTPLVGDQGVVEEVLPRRTVLSRGRSEARGEQVMLANPDHAVLVFAVREPQPHLGMLDRYLTLCEYAGVDVTICFNKVDLSVPAEIEAASVLYAGLGYFTLFTSATTGQGVNCLRQRLLGRTSLLTGPSGVGKSSLINVLLPEARQRIGEVSEATGKGRHTTTGVRLLPLEDGGWLADSAGIRELALWNVPSGDLPQTFVELRPFASACRYADCEHSEAEEGCALWEALAAGRISPERFASFERLLAEARAAEPEPW